MSCHVGMSRGDANQRARVARSSSRLQQFGAQARTPYRDMLDRHRIHTPRCRPNRHMTKEKKKEKE